MRHEIRDQDKHAPHGYRFLFQAIDAKSADEAIAEVRRIFKVQDVRVVRGVYLPLDRQGTCGPLSNPWTFRPDAGYMAFCPKGKR